jgi:hypothetical protein
MTEAEFLSIMNTGKRYTVDATLRGTNESWDDFVKRAKEEDLGVWVEDPHLSYNGITYDQNVVSA